MRELKVIILDADNNVLDRKTLEIPDGHEGCGEASLALTKSGSRIIQTYVGVLNIRPQETQ